MEYTTLKTRILCFESNQEVLGFKTYKVDFAKQVITSRITGIVRTSGHDSGYLDEGFSPLFTNYMGCDVEITYTIVDNVKIITSITLATV